MEEVTETKSFMGGGEDDDIFLPHSKENSISYKDVVLKAIEKCRIEGSKEMVRGGEHMHNIEGRWVVETIPDQRKVYIQSVNVFYDLLLFYFDDTIKKRMKHIKKNINEAYRRFYTQYISIETWRPFLDKAKKTGIIPAGKESSVGAYIMQEMEDYKLLQYRRIFQELLLLFKRKNELSKVTYLDPDE